MSLCALIGVTATGITMVRGSASAATDNKPSATATAYKMTSAEKNTVGVRLTPGSWHGYDEKGNILGFNFSLPQGNCVRFFDNQANALDCPMKFIEATGTYEIRNILLKQTQQFKVLENDGENAVLFNEHYGRITLEYDDGLSAPAQMDAQGIPDGIWYARGIGRAEDETGTSDYFIFNSLEGTFDRVSMDDGAREHAGYSFDSGERELVLTFDDGHTERWLLAGGGGNYAALVTPRQEYTLDLLGSEVSPNQKFYNQADLRALAGKYYAASHNGEQREFISDVWHSGDGHVFLTVADGSGKVDLESINMTCPDGVDGKNVIFYDVDMLTLKGVDSVGNTVDFSKLA